MPGESHEDVFDSVLRERFAGSLLTIFSFTLVLSLTPPPWSTSSLIQSFCLAVSFVSCLNVTLEHSCASVLAPRYFDGPRFASAFGFWSRAGCAAGLFALNPFAFLYAEAFHVGTVCVELVLLWGMVGCVAGLYFAPSGKEVVRGVEALVQCAGMGVYLFLVPRGLLASVEFAWGRFVPWRSREEGVAEDIVKIGMWSKLRKKGHRRGGEGNESARSLSIDEIEFELGQHRAPWLQNLYAGLLLLSTASLFVCVLISAATPRWVSALVIPRMISLMILPVYVSFVAMGFLAQFGFHGYCTASRPVSNANKHVAKHPSQKRNGSMANVLIERNNFWGFVTCSLLVGLVSDLAAELILGVKSNNHFLHRSPVLDRLPIAVMYDVAFISRVVLLTRRWVPLVS